MQPKIDFPSQSNNTREEGKLHYPSCLACINFKINKEAGKNHFCKASGEDKEIVESPYTHTCKFFTGLIINKKSQPNSITSKL